MLMLFCFRFWELAPDSHRRSALRPPGVRHPCTTLFSLHDMCYFCSIPTLLISSFSVVRVWRLTGHYVRVHTVKRTGDTEGQIRWNQLSSISDQLVANPLKWRRIFVPIVLVSRDKRDGARERNGMFTCCSSSSSSQICIASITEKEHRRYSKKSRIKNYCKT